MSSTQHQRFPALDLIRAVAIMLVVGYHANGHLHHAPARMKTLLGTGWSGVYLFFVLSGFLIGELTFREIKKTGRLDIRRFWIRRIFRTWPLYFLLLAFLAPRAQEISPPLVHYLTFTQNFFPTEFFIQTWSLAIEEQFYLVFPLMMAALLLARKVKWIAGVCVAGIMGAFAFRFFNFAGNHTFAAIDSILTGILVGYLHHFRPETLQIIRRRYAASILLGILVAFLPLALPDPSSEREMLLRGGFALGFGLIVAACSGHEFPRVRWIESRLVAIVAMTSYANYLTHDRPLFWVARAANAMSLEGAAHTTFILALGVASSLALACVIYPMIELPALRLRDRLFPRR